MAPETVSHFDTPNARQVTNMSPSGSQEALKFANIDTWTSRCLLGVPEPLEKTKLALRVAKWSLKDCKMTISGITDGSFQQAASHQLSAARGFGGRGEAFKYLMT